LYLLLAQVSWLRAIIKIRNKVSPEGNAGKSKLYKPVS